MPELVRLGVFERVEAMAKEPPRGSDVGSFSTDLLCCQLISYIQEDDDDADRAEELNARNSAMSR